MERPIERCRECGADCSKLAPRLVIRIDLSTKLPRGKNHIKLVGSYCRSDCVLDAIARGRALRT